jgi:hypothetical protein
MIPRRVTIAFALAASLVTPAIARAQGGLQMVGFAGTAKGALGAIVDPDRNASFLGAELVANRRGVFHWTFGVAHSRMTTVNSCCGPNPTLSYHYQTYLPSVGIAYDFPVKPFRLRIGGSAGPLVLRQSRSGTPPPGVGGGDPSWQWQFLYTAMGASLHYEWRDTWGIVAGTRLYNRHNPFGGTSDGQLAPYLGLSWSWPRPSARSNKLDSLSPTPRLDSETRPANDAQIARVFARVPRRTGLRVATSDSVVEGRFSALRADSVVIATAAGPHAVGLSDITSAWKSQRRVGRSTWRGALWGGGIAAALAALGTMRQPDCDYCINDPGTAAVLFAIPGTAAGAIVGHLVGWIHRPWRRMFP